MNKLAILSLSVSIVLMLTSCVSGRNGRQTVETTACATFTNPIRQGGSSPCLVYADGKYYYTQSTYVRVSLWTSETIAGLNDAEEHIVYTPDEAYYISGPRLYRFNRKWYIYYTSDDGDMSRRIVHVLENSSQNPLEGEFMYKGIIKTGNQKSFHPSVFEHKGNLYFFWSGYDSSDKGDIDISHIYVSRMSDPWTLDTAPAAIISPQYEWECQWMSENGLTAEKPSYVNEAPQAIYSVTALKCFCILLQARPIPHLIAKEWPLPMLMQTLQILLHGKRFPVLYLVLIRLSRHMAQDIYPSSTRILKIIHTSYIRHIQNPDLTVWTIVLHECRRLHGMRTEFLY